MQENYRHACHSVPRYIHVHVLKRNNIEHSLLLHVKFIKMLVELCFIFEANATAIRARKRPVKIVRRHAMPLPLVSHKISSPRERSTTNVACVPLRRRRDVGAPVWRKIAAFSKAFTAHLACVEVVISGEVRCCCHSRRWRHVDAVTRAISSWDAWIGVLSNRKICFQHRSPIIRTFLSSKWR